MSALAHARTDVLSAAKPYRVTPRGLEISRALTPDEAADCLRLIGNFVNATSWAIGDWLVYAETRGEYGDFYAHAAHITARGLEALSQAARVSKAFALAQRVVGASWTSHREVLRLPVQKRRAALEKAVKEGWTRLGLAQHVTQSTRRRIARLVAAGEAAPTNLLKSAQWRNTVKKSTVQCPECGHRFRLSRKPTTTQEGETHAAVSL